MVNLKNSALKNGIEFVKYFMTSCIALAVDYGCYWLLVEYKIMNQPNAAVTGYLTGLLLAYFLLTFHVFQDGWLKQKKHYEILLFFLTGGIGASVTYVTVLLYINWVAENSHRAKLAAIVVSFVVVYLLRKFFVFKKAGAY